MAASVGTIFLDVQLNTSSINSQLQQIKNQAGGINFASGNSSLKSMISNMQAYTQSTKDSLTATMNMTTQLNNSSNVVDKISKRVKDADGNWVTISRTIKNATSQTNKMQQGLKRTGTIANTLKNSLKQSNTAIVGMKASTNSLNTSFSLLNSTVGMLKRNFLYFFSIYKLINFASESLDLGSGLVEDEHLLDITLGNMSDNMKDYIKTLKASTGMAQAEATKLASGFTRAFKAMGMGDEQNNAFTQELMQKMGDVASAYNMSYQKTYEKFMSAIVGGNARSGRELGISILVQDMQKYMESIGDTRNYNSLSSYEKMLLRYQKTMKDLDFTTGDFVKTQHTWTNQTRILSSTWNNFKTVVGQNLIMLLTPVLEVVNKLISSFESLAISVNTFFKSLGWGSRLGNGGIGSSVDEYTDAIDDANDSIANSASGAAKKIQRALMGFDKVSRLSSSSSSGSGGSSASGSSLDFSVNSNEIAETETQVSGMITRLKEQLEGFKVGFNEAFQASPSKITENFNSIGTTLKEIFAGVDFSVEILINNILYNLGRITGSFASIGTSMVILLTSSINQALETNKQRIITWFNDLTVELSATLNQVGNFSTSMAGLFTVFEGENATNVFSDLIQIVQNTFMDITLLGTKMVNDIVTLVTKPFTDNMEIMRTNLDLFLGSFSNLTGGVKGILDTVGTELNALYDEHVSPLLGSLTTGISEFVKILQEKYNEYIAPVIDKLSEKSQELMQELEPIFKDIKAAIGDIIDVIKIVWETYLSPLLNWLAEKLTPVLGFLLDVLGNVGLYIAGGFIQAIKLGIGIIKSITSFIKGLVETTANVVNAFTNMKDGIVGAFESIPDAIKSAINAAIGFINSMINSFNSIKIDVPNPFGENYKYSPTIPNIPQLANGGYVKAGRGGVLAQIGEGRYNEIVKNDKQRQIDNNYVLDGVEKLIDSKLSNMGTLQPVIIQVGDTELATVLIDVLRGEVKRTGKSILA